MKHIVKNVILLWGLPGSGKTRFMESIHHAIEETYNNKYNFNFSGVEIWFERLGYNYFSIDLFHWDTLMSERFYTSAKDNELVRKREYRRALRSMKEHLENRLYEVNSGRKNCIVIDWPFSTNADVMSLLEEYVILKGKNIFAETSLRIIQFDGSREDCAWNCLGRPIEILTTKSESDSKRYVRKPIEGAVANPFEHPYEEPDILKLADLGFYDIKIEKVPVIRRPVLDLVSNAANGELFSPYWVTDYETRGVETDFAPDEYYGDNNVDREFPELEDLLFALGIDSHRLYKLIKKECVQLVTDELYDYYSRANISMWKCDLKHLEKVLLDNGYNLQEIASKVASGEIKPIQRPIKRC